MRIDDARAALDAALLETLPDTPMARMVGVDMEAVRIRARAAVWPILQGLADKLAAAEAERGEATHNMEAWRRVADENIAKRRAVEAERNTWRERWQAVNRECNKAVNALRLAGRNNR